MLANKSIVKSEFEPLTGSVTVKEAKRRMGEQEMNTLPVVDSTTQKLIGQVALDQLESLDEDTLISDVVLEEALKIFQGQHIFEVARLMFQYELYTIPVVDDQQTYLGVITKQQVLEALSKMLNLAEFGSVVTVSLDPIDFTISEIVQIIETEGAKILGLTVESPDSGKQIFEVSFKLNVRDVSRIKAALNRYGYTVLAESESTAYGQDLENRADELLKYIDM
ncbi:MAG TPA: CBS domain-containing protein [Balneolaceae bacterium]|nr:CBS domain-containing protein [Balneolaceae bacterium]